MEMQKNGFSKVAAQYLSINKFLLMLVLNFLIQMSSTQISFINQSSSLMQDLTALLKNPHTVLLDIPARLQWENGHGFCGETSIQSCGLYYGNYLSQLPIRKAAGSQVLVGQNAEQTLAKLGFIYQSWDNQSPQPQYKNYLQWIKSNILSGYPVIITGYAPDEKDASYDHIYLAVGVYSTNYEQYSDNDVLIYADLFDENYTLTPFGKIWDSRSMQGNGKNLDFAIPKQVDYGIAVKGIIDQEEFFLPVRVSLQENSEPNVSLDEEAVEFELKVRVSKLTPGVKYAILRYSSYKNLPTDQVIASKAEKVTRFVANGPIYDMVDVCSSDATVYYRCVEEKYLQ